jgi:hypothetical protein
MKRIIYISGFVIIVFIMIFNICALDVNHNLVSINLEGVKANACENEEGITSVILCMQECIVSSSNGVTLYGCEDADDDCDMP